MARGRREKCTVCNRTVAVDSGLKLWAHGDPRCSGSGSKVAKKVAEVGVVVDESYDWDSAALLNHNRRYGLAASQNVKGAWVMPESGLAFEVDENHPDLKVAATQANLASTRQSLNIAQEEYRKQLSRETWPDYVAPARDSNWWRVEIARIEEALLPPVEEAEVA